MTIIEFTSLQRKLNLSDAKLGALLDVDRATVWRWRTGAQKVDRRTEYAMRYLTGPNIVLQRKINDRLDTGG